MFVFFFRLDSTICLSWQSDWLLLDENCFELFFRYLAPEYSNDGKVTEKVDVYAFGLVVLELITGRKTNDLQCYSGQHLLPGSLSPTPGNGPYLSAFKNQLLDSNLTSSQLENFPYELQAMSHAAYMCLQEDPHQRPPISKVHFSSFIIYWRWVFRVLYSIP